MKEIYVCPECGFTTTWTIQDLDERGTPVCPNDDTDMVLKGGEQL